MTTVLRELVASLGMQVDGAAFTKATKSVENVKAGLQQMDGRMRDANGRFLGVGAAATQVAGRFRDVNGRLREASGRFVGTGAAAGAFGGSAKGASAGVLGLAGATSKLQSGLLQLGIGLGIGALIKQMVTLASDANETDNVLSEVFGSGGADEIKQWAQDTSKFMGRSEFTLRKNAGALGAMLEPMTGSADKAKEMSKNIGALAIDLASFFNTADDDALVALKSGLTGEAEPLKKYGIVLLDATLQEFAHTRGINTKVQAMKVAEKTELRYQFILANSTKAQGDAHRTIDGFANASRRLGDNLKDLGTRMGQKLLPIAGQLIVWGNNAISMFLEVSRKSTIFEAALGTLAVAFAVLKVQAALALIGPLLAFGALALAVDDINTLFSGGQSAMGRWLDEAGGIGTAQEFVDDFRAAMDAASVSLREILTLYREMPDAAGVWELMTGAVDDVGFAIERLWDRFEKFIYWYQDVPQSLLTGAMDILGIKHSQEDASGYSKGQGVGADRAEGLDEELDLRRSQRNDSVRTRYEDRKLQREALRAGREAGDELGLAPLASGQVRAPVAAAAMVSAPWARGGEVPAGNSTTVTNGPINIHVGQGVGAAEAGRAARRAADAERRRTADAIKRGA